MGPSRVRDGRRRSQKKDPRGVPLASMGPSRVRDGRFDGVGRVFREIFASMGPSRVRDGRPRRRLGGAPNRARFNGAVACSRRKAVTVSAPPAASISASMGPSRVRDGRDFAAATAVSSTRSFNGAVACSRRKDFQTVPLCHQHHVASMGPSRVRDGRKAAKKVYEERVLLQWGRRVFATEGCHSLTTSADAGSLLQWGRRVFATEGGKRS